MRALLGEIVEHRVARAVSEPVVAGMDPEVRAHDRVVVDEPAEARLDEVVQAVVERPGVGRAIRSGEGYVGQGGHWGPCFRDAVGATPNHRSAGLGPGTDRLPRAGAD